MANALSDFIGGFQAGNAITDQQRQQRQGNQLRQLAPQIVQGDPQAYVQAAAIDPQAAQQYQQGGDEIARRARGAAKFLQTALQSGNPQQIMAARQTIMPFMETLKPGTPYPLDLDPQHEMAGIQGFLAQTAYLDPSQNGMGSVQSTYINRAGQRVAIMRDGSQQLLGEADARTQLRDQPGIDPTIVDLRTGQQQPVLAAGGQASAPILPQGGGQKIVDQEAQLANQMIAAGIPADQVDRVMQSRAAQFSGAAQGAAPATAQARPAISPAEQARLDLAQQANSRAEMADRRAQDAAERAAKGNPPAGMRWNAAGTALEPIPGAPAPAGNASEDERKAAGWFGQATRALENMRQAMYQHDSQGRLVLGKDGKPIPTGADDPGLIETYSPFEEIANRSRDPNRQRYVNAASSLSEALLRAATGAGVNESEARQKIAEVTPQRGDSAELKAQKMAAAEGYLQDLQARAGRALRSPGPSAPTRTVVRTGTLNGRKVIQYSDGTTDYGN